VVQVIAKGFVLGSHSYLRSGWNVMDGGLVFISLLDIVISLTATHSPKIFGVLRVFRLLRTLRPLRCVLSPASQGTDLQNISYDLSYDYRKFVVRSTYDSDLRRAKISLRNIVS